MDILLEGKRVFDVEIEALQRTKESLDDTFINIHEIIQACCGKIVFTGMGKPGHIARKLAATFSSLGKPSFYLHPAEAMHGDLGMISKNDIIIAISYSGESDEIIRILPNIKMIGSMIIGITGNSESTLAKFSDILQVLPDFEEACSLGLAPTSSTTAVLCYGDALAVVASEYSGFTETDFGRFHPAGALGKKILLKVEDLMAKELENSIVEENTMLKEAIVEMSKKGLGIVNVVDVNGKILGIITDGDLRRLLEKGVDIYSLKAEEVMNKSPFLIQFQKYAVEALRFMKDLNISCMPVVDDDRLVGTIRIQQIIGSGIVI